MKIYSALYGGFHPLDAFFPDAECIRVDKPGDLDGAGILIIHGGADISPTLYKKSRSQLTYAQEEPSYRDKAEWALIQEAVKKKIPVFGICRGAQMLCAAAGGYLIQHVNGHFRHHKVKTKEGEEFYVNSIHHQMQAPWDVDHELLAASDHRYSNVYYDVDDMVSVPEEPEAVFYPQLRSIGFQWHPEGMDEASPANVWVKKQVEERLL